MPFLQQKRLLALDTSLGPDAMLVRSFSGWEAISAPFQLDLELACENDSVDLRSLLGTSATLRMARSGDTTRYWNGRISKVTQASRDPMLTSYRMEVVPWLSFLKLRQDCRIFQEKTVQDILTEVFATVGFHDFEFRLHGSLAKREYCVQYRETDFHFVSRLLEEEGIFYFFEHESDRHVLVIANTSEAHTPCPQQQSARCVQSSHDVSEEDVIDEWSRNEEFLTSSVSINDFNFKTPATNLLVSLDRNSPFELYDFPGLHQKMKPGQDLARVRLEELSTSSSLAHGQGTCRGFCTGYRFTLKDHYRDEWNDDYVLVEIRHSATQGSDYHAGSLEGGDTVYRNEFHCIPYSVPFRPLRGTARPIMTGCQTAIIVGPAGEEVYTDKFGRVKVQFHWDRKGKRNEQSSCWIRVSQTWAGKNWGAISIPRIGQEVIVDFLEGNPDQPIIVGCVYNAEQMPPYNLPADSVTMGFKSKTAKGSGYNEVVLVDNKDAELIRVHAQKDMDTTVCNNDKQHVQADRDIAVDGKHHEAVKGEIVVKSTDDQIYIEAKKQITVVVGQSKLFMNEAGEITLSGVRVTVLGSERIDLNPAT